MSGIGAYTGAYGYDSPTVAVPSGAVAGDLYVLAVECYIGLTWPAGFTEVPVYADDSATYGANLRVAIKVATGSESGDFVVTPAELYTFWIASCCVVSGYSAPPQAYSAVSTPAGWSSTLPAPGDSITTSAANELVLWVLGVSVAGGNGGTVTITPPTGLTVGPYYATPGATVLAVAEGVQSAAGAATYSGSVSFGGVSDGRAANVITLAFTPVGADPTAISLESVATLSGTLTTGIQPRSDLAAASSVAAALSTAIRPAAALSSVATLSATLESGSAALETAMLSSAAVTAALSTDIQLSADLATASSTSGSLSTAIQPVATLAASSSLSADLSSTILLASAPQATSTLQGSLTGSAAQLAAEVSSVATLSGTLTEAQAELVASLSSSSSLLGTLNSTTPLLESALGASSSMSGTLTNVGDTTVELALTTSPLVAQLLARGALALVINLNRNPVKRNLFREVIVTNAAPTVISCRERAVSFPLSIGAVPGPGGSLYAEYSLDPAALDGDPSAVWFEIGPATTVNKPYVLDSPVAAIRFTCVGSAGIVQLAS